MPNNCFNWTAANALPVKQMLAGRFAHKEKMKIIYYENHKINMALFAVWIICICFFIVIGIIYKKIDGIIVLPWFCTFLLSIYFLTRPQIYLAPFNSLKIYDGYIEIIYKLPKALTMMPMQQKVNISEIIRSDFNEMPILDNQFYKTLYYVMTFLGKKNNRLYIHKSTINNGTMLLKYYDLYSKEDKQIINTFLKVEENQLTTASS